VKPSWSRQYASVIFYHDDRQKMLAAEKKKARSDVLGTRLFTDIVPFTVFYPAEDYHQKYHLKRHGELAGSYEAIYPDPEDFVRSTAVARVNGYAGGYGLASQLKEEIDLLGLSEKGRAVLLKLVR